MNAVVEQLIHDGFVQLSVELPCEKCGVLVRFVGEHKPNGNWYCPSCGHWMPYESFEGSQIKVWLRAQRVVDSAVLFPSGSETV